MADCLTPYHGGLKVALGCRWWHCYVFGGAVEKRKSQEVLEENADKVGLKGKSADVCGGCWGGVGLALGRT